MSKFGDLIRGKIQDKVSALKVEAAPAPEPVIEEVVVEEVVAEEAPVTKESTSFEEMNKEELEAYGREHGVELDRRRSKKALIAELEELEE